MTKYVAMHRPQRRFSFWQRTVTVFVLALIALLIGLAFLYNRPFSLASQSQGAVIEVVAPASDATALATLQPSLDLQPPSMGSESDTTSSRNNSWLFNGAATATAAPSMADSGETARIPSVTGALAVPLSNPQELAATPLATAASNNLNERPALLRDLRLSEQALAEDEPRVATELLLALVGNYPTFRPAEVADRLYHAYLALGDQAMRRGAQSEAIGYYNQAGRLAVADDSALQRRRDAIARYFPTQIPSAQASSDEPVQAPANPTIPTGQGAPPIAAVAPAATATPTPVPPVIIDVAPRCPDDHIALTAPTVNALVSGSIAVVGSVRLENLWFYKLEWAAAGSDEYSYFGGTARSVTGNVLGRLDTTSLPNGKYLVRVTVVDSTGNYPPPCEVPVIVAN